MGCILFVRYCAIFVLCSVLTAEAVRWMKPEAYMTTPQLAKSAGYPVESHRAETEDGYLLQLHRIPAGRRTARRTGSRKGKRAVFLQHGLTGSSMEFVCAPDIGLAYKLADSGFDVWMGNFRGNAYTAHRNMSKHDAKFWDFSFHEHGKFDLPAMIDKALAVTGLPRILYLGYSMGGTSLLTMLSQRPEYNEKLVAFVGISPAVYMDTRAKLVAEIALRSLNIPRILSSRGIISLAIPPDVLDMALLTFCNVKREADDICMRIVYLAVGEDYEKNDWDLSIVYLARMQPASIRQLEHFGKIALTGEFTEWNGGLMAPVKLYNLTQVKIPVALFYGENDQLTTKKELFRLAETFKRTGVLEDLRPVSPWHKFNHIDYFVSQGVGESVIGPLVSYLNKLYSKYS